MTVLTTEELRGMMRAISEKLSQYREELDQLDAALGDGDHGTGVSLGFQATLDPISTADTPTAVWKAAAMPLMNRIGGTSGALMGTLFLKGAMAIDNTETITPAQFAAMWQAGRDGVAQRGQAQPGDKTMLDALTPGVDALTEQLAGGAAFTEALRAAADAAQKGAEATATMQARHGRAKYIGERAIGHIDAGARSVALMFAAMRDYCEENQSGQA